MPLKINEKLREMDMQQKLIEEKRKEIERKLELKKLDENKDNLNNVQINKKIDNLSINQSIETNFLKNDINLNNDTKKLPIIGKTLNKSRFQINIQKTNNSLNLLEHNTFDNDSSQLNSTIESVNKSNEKTENDFKEEQKEKITKSSNILDTSSQSSSFNQYYSMMNQNMYSNYRYQMPPYNSGLYPDQQSYNYMAYNVSNPYHQAYSNMYSNMFGYPPNMITPPPPQSKINQPSSTLKISPVPLMSLSNIAPTKDFLLNNTLINNYSSKNNINNELDLSENNYLEDEYESFLRLAGQETKKNDELYNPEEATSDNEDTSYTKNYNLEIDLNVKNKIEQIAERVASNGLSYEDELKNDSYNYWWLINKSSKEYEYYKDCLDNELKLKIDNSMNKIDNFYQNKSTDNRKRKSRWSNQDDESNKKPAIASIFKSNDSDDEVSERVGFGFNKSTFINDNKDDFMKQMKEATDRARNIAEQLNIQMELYPEGYKPNDQSSISVEHQKQYEQQKELQKIYEKMTEKRKEIEDIAKKMKFKYEYDSDEECDPQHGTWEHILRKAEMDATKEWAMTLTDMADNKHHIGDFLPPDEYKKFMETYKALKEGHTPEFSDYKEFKINAENAGYKLLKKLGWQEGQGLGKDNQGVTAPINKSAQSHAHAGFGLSDSKPDSLKKDDDEFSMYRKRMMLAYKFRPNPMNNPRRPY